MSRRPTPEVVVRCQGRRIAQYSAEGWVSFPRSGGSIALKQKARREPFTNSRVWDATLGCWGCDSGPHTVNEERLQHYYSEAKRLGRTKNVKVNDLL